MRTKRLITGLDNSQKIRFIVNGFAMYCRIKDIENIATECHRVAVWLALEQIGSSHGSNQPITSYSSNRWQGVDVQVDLIDDNTVIR